MSAIEPIVCEELHPYKERQKAVQSTCGPKLEFVDVRGIQLSTLSILFQC